MKTNLTVAKEKMEAAIDNVLIVVRPMFDNPELWKLRQRIMDAVLEVHASAMDFGMELGNPKNRMEVAS